MQGCGGFLRSVLAGCLIGIGCVLPGVSGGVMAVSMGLYRPMLDAITGLFHDTREKLRFLTPLALGGGLGILLGARLLNAAMTAWEQPMLYLFAGFIAGGIPDLLREAEGRERFRPRWLLAMLGGVALALPMALPTQDGAQTVFLTPVQALITGILEGIGTVTPGVSTSFVLINLGWYQAYLQAVSSLDLRALLPMAAGFAASALLCLKGMKWLFDHAQGYAYYTVLGFLLVSVALAFPGLAGGWTGALYVALGAIVARLMSRIGTKEGVNPCPKKKET